MKIIIKYIDNHVTRAYQIGILTGERDLDVLGFWTTLFEQTGVSYDLEFIQEPSDA